MKERLTGAIILVALIVVLVPELLSGPIRPAARAHGPGSSAEEPPLRSYTINLADEAHGGSPASSPAPSPEPLTPEPAAPPAATAPMPSPQPAPAEPTAAKPTPAKPAAPPAPTIQSPGAGAYVVQLGSFAKRANADRLAQQVHALGFQVSVAHGARLYRVQVGPARDRAAAEQMAAKLSAKGHAGTVVPR